MPSLLQKPWFAESIQCWVGYPQHVSGAVLLPFSLSVHIFFKLFFTFISFQISVLYIYIFTDIDLWYFGLIYICLIVLIYWLNWPKRYLQEFYMHCESNDLQDLSPEVIWYNMIEISFLFVIYITGFITRSILVLHDRDLLLLVTNVLTVHGRQKKGQTPIKGG